MDAASGSNGGTRRPGHLSTIEGGSVEHDSIHSPLSPKHPFQSAAGELGRHVLLGLTLAGMASSLLTTVFGLFHVDVFLRAYQLPLTTYSIGSFVFSIVNTANDLVGAWIVDHAAISMKRVDLIAISGIFSSICFLAPFFRWKKPSPPWDAVHFVASLSLHDTAYSFSAILLGSVLTDNHHMSDQQRVQFMASGRIVNLLASFVTARIGLAMFDVDDLFQFRVFLLLLSALALVLYFVAQITTSGTQVWKKAFQLKRWFRCIRSLKRKRDTSDHSTNSSAASNEPGQRIHFRRVIADFWSHKNFRAWIGMEMLLEAQNTFIIFFLKTFMDQLILDAWSRESCDWMLSVIRPLKEIVGIATYIPIRKFGYQRMYTLLFIVNFLMSSAMFLFANPESIQSVTAFLFVYPILTGAIQSAGFHLAMSDMVMEMKRKHAIEGRHDAPSLAGLFMGANALLCKPMESLLPIIAGIVFNRRGESKPIVFRLLIAPPLVFSIFQFLFWSRFDLTPLRTARMRDELKVMQSRHCGDLPETSTKCQNA